MMDLDAMQNMVWSIFARQTEQWKPEYKQILHSTVVDIVRERDHLRVMVKPTVDDPIAEEIRQYLLKVIFDPIARIMGAYKCQVRKFE
jgi:hypothetical protein